MFSYQWRLCSRCWQNLTSTRRALFANCSTKINTSSFSRQKLSLINKMALQSQPAKLLSLHKVPLYCVVLVPTLADVLRIPLTSALSCFSYVAAVDHIVFTSLTVSLPGACLWSLCINVKLSLISCILLSLFYYYFIINIVIFYYIRLLFWLLLCVFFCHPVVSFCSMLFLVVLCIYPCCPLPQFPFVLRVTV